VTRMVSLFPCVRVRPALAVVDQCARVSVIPAPSWADRPETARAEANATVAQHRFTGSRDVIVFDMIMDERFLPHTSTYVKTLRLR
jgi:hypothetical protein